MKAVFTLNPFTSAGGGSHSFARVLAEGLPAHGITVSFDVDSPADVLLVFAQHGSERLLERHRARGARILHRLDERIDAGEGKVRRDKHERIARLNARADLTIFQSEFVRGNVGPMCRAPQARIIHNGVDLRIFSPEGPRQPLEGAPAALHVSWSVGDSKRLDRVGELLAAGPPGLRVYCAGRHAESGQRWLADPRVTLLGPRPRDAVAALMRSADLLFFPSELEPCPNTPLEAMASGLPTLYHPSGGTPELLGDAAVAMTGSLSEDLARLLGEPDVWRARALARAPRFSAELATTHYATVMTEAAAIPATAPLSRTRRLWTRRGY
ncbi:MAG TPA: glycosyltransferase family 4 protein [Candidatus Limnocylindria bacterium]|nr:glycosyltransferase family 4 protein [Candidatus Limnocylindria bacterium]